MRPFANEHQAHKQQRAQIGWHTYFGMRVAVFSALPHEDLYKFIGKDLEVKFLEGGQVFKKKIVSIGYDASGGCWPVVFLDDESAICLSAQGFEYVHVLDDKGQRLN